ncbi:MAG: dephospho-CoA kinase [Bacteroidales bacterium]
MIKVGLTGNLGAGKSTVARIFEQLGVPVYHADDEAKRFLNSREVVNKLRESFGPEIINPDNTVNRKKLASVVFRNPEALAFLNSLIHPMVRNDLKKWIENYKEHSYIVQEAAILFESGFHKEFDKIIVVVAPPELTLQRVMERDHISEGDVEARRRNQWPQEKLIERADFIIHNDGVQSLIEQVLAVHRKLSAS